MCALTIAPPPPDHTNDSSWAARAARVRLKVPDDARSVALSFRDLRIRAEDLTTVGEALAGCPPETMLDAVMRHEAKWRISTDALGSRARHMLVGRIATALDTMRSLEDAAVELMPSREGFVGPLFRFVASANGSGLEHEVSAAVLAAEDARAVRQLVEGGMRRVRTWDELRTLWRETESSALASQLAPEALRGSVTLLARMPWERVLALPLWLPADLTSDEQHAVLAKVFWAMTYRGFVRDEVRSGATDGSLADAKRRAVPARGAPWPNDPVGAVLGHNCWVDTLEAWDALFAAIRPSETRL